LRPTTATMVEQLKAIGAYNDALNAKKKKPKKDAYLPDIQAPNMHSYWA